MNAKHKATIRSREGLGRGYYVLDLSAPDIAMRAKPGQFVMITVSESTDPLLPRPFSILDTGGESVSLLVKRIGKGTRRLCEMISGMEVGILGPLGNGFPPVEKVALVAGGYGVAPFYMLTGGNHRPREAHLFYGAHSSGDILFLNEFENRLGRQRCHIATEDGSLGFQGLVTRLLETRLEEEEWDAVFTCGPTAMMRRVQELAAERSIPCFVSLENVMGCGYGVCLGCTVPTDEGMVRSCTDGPIFDGTRIRWGEI